MSELPLQADAPLIDAVRAIEKTHRRMAVVISANGSLMGTLTDGDIRRCLLAGGSLKTPVSNAMNPKPITAEPESSEEYIRDLIQRANVQALPLVASDGKYLRLVHLTDLANQSDEIEALTPGFSFAVVMAGGEGTRLRPLTEVIPKPMVEIGGIPLLARQIQRLSKVGIKRIYISVNYLSHVIEDYFRDGFDFGVEIRYLREKGKLGTAGALGLLPEVPDGPIIVMNGDLLTTFNFESFNTFHRSQGAAITVAAIDHRVDIPYGVIRANGSFVTEIVEKPSERFLCNAGIYALSPAALKLLPNGAHSDMTDLIATALGVNLLIAVFPIHEYWSDIGTAEDLEKARLHFSKAEN